MSFKYALKKSKISLTVISEYNLCKIHISCVLKNRISNYVSHSALKKMIILQQQLLTHIKQKETDQISQSDLTVSSLLSAVSKAVRQSSREKTKTVKKWWVNRSVSCKSVEQLVNEEEEKKDIKEKKKNKKMRVIRALLKVKEIFKLQTMQEELCKQTADVCQCETLNLITSDIEYELESVIENA